MIKKATVKGTDQVKVTFVLPAEISPARISVLGDFNDWRPSQHVLQKRSNGTMSASVTLSIGQRIRFRYYDANGGWFNDTQADAYESGPFGAENSIIQL